MARGWESKSVEAQQDEASREAQNTRPRLTPEQAARQRQIEGLVLSKRRVLQQLASTQDARRRHMLESALADLDRSLQQLT